MGSRSYSPGRRLRVKLALSFMLAASTNVGFQCPNRNQGCGGSLVGAGGIGTVAGGGVRVPASPVIPRKPGAGAPSKGIVEKVPGSDSLTGGFAPPPPAGGFRDPFAPVVTGGFAPPPPEGGFRGGVQPGQLEAAVAPPEPAEASKSIGDPCHMP